MSLRLVTAPSSYPVSLAETKTHLRVDHDDMDDHIELIIQAETAYSEDFTGRKLVPQTWDVLIDAFPEDAPLRLPIPKVNSVEAVYYLDGDGAEQTLDSSVYVADVDSEPARFYRAEGASWPTTQDGLNSVRIRMTVGNELAGSSPPEPEVLADMKIAILLRVQATYDGGDSAQALRDIADIYLRRRRVHLALA